MTPRLATSKKWTALPKELVEQVTQVFADTFKKEISDKGVIRPKGRIYDKELLIRVGYNEKGRLFQANFDISVEYDPKKTNALQIVYLGVDCAAALMAEYFRLDSLDEFPGDWQKMDFEGKKVFIRATSENTELESKADELLGLANDQLVGGSDDELEIAAIKGSLGIAPEDED